MRAAHLLAFLVLCTTRAGVAAAPDFAGRWEGRMEIPGAPQPLVLDLEAAGGGWGGSAILSGRGVKGAPLGGVKPDGDALRLELGAALPFPADPPPQLLLRHDGAEQLRGELRFAGLSAPVQLQRTGDPQVDRPLASTPVPAVLEGEWNGRYELLGSAREVSLKLAGTHAGMRIVGRRTTDIDFALVRARDGFISLSGNGYDIAFEGRWNAATQRIEGTFLQGPLELPLQLQRKGN